MTETLLLYAFGLVLGYCMGVALRPKRVVVNYTVNGTAFDKAAEYADVAIRSARSGPGDA